MAENKAVRVQGRIVWVAGDLFKGEQAKVYKTTTPKLNKAGQPYQEYGFGLAVHKSVLQNVAEGQPGHIWAAIHEEAYKMFPNRVIPASFAMKVQDGDTGVNRDGVQLNTKKGYPGHMIFTMKTTIPIKWYKRENGQMFQIAEGIKCGDYVDCSLTISSHAGANSGIYLNPNACEFLLAGEGIVNAPSGEQLFGQQAAIPFGAVAQQVPAGYVAPSVAGPAQQFAPQAPVTPNYNVVPAQFAPQAQQAPAAPQFAPAPTGAPQVPGIPQVPR